MTRWNFTAQFVCTANLFFFLLLLSLHTTSFSWIAFARLSQKMRCAKKAWSSDRDVGDV